MNPSNLKSSSIVPKCLKYKDPEAEIFLMNHDLIAAIENFMAQGTKFWNVTSLFHDVMELIQNLIVSLVESENWKEVTFWRSQMLRLEDQCDNLRSMKYTKDYSGSEAMVVGLDCKGFEKVKGDVNVDEYRVKAKETDYDKIDVKPNVDKAPARKEDYEYAMLQDSLAYVEKVKSEETKDIQFKYVDKLDDPLDDGNLDIVEKEKDDLEKVKFSEIKENDENYDKPIEIPDYEFKDEETLVIPQEVSPMDSASSGIFFPEGC